MNTLKTLLIILATVASFSAMADINDDVAGVPVKHKNLFTFRTEKDLIGGQVEVFSSNGNLITTQKLQKKKLTIDFGEARLDTYTIRVTKGRNAKEYHYIKR